MDQEFQDHWIISPESLEENFNRQTKCLSTSTVSTYFSIQKQGGIMEELSREVKTAPIIEYTEGMKILHKLLLKAVFKLRGMAIDQKGTIDNLLEENLALRNSIEHVQPKDV